MTAEQNSDLIELMRRTARGEGTYRELADALNRLDGLVLPVPPADFARFMGDLDNALEEKGYGNVKVGDAEKPRGIGLTLKDGRFVPQMFTNDNEAREFAVTSGLIEPDAALPMQVTPAASVMYDSLVAGHGGIQLDPKTDHQVNLDRGIMARLYALMTMKEFVEIGSLHVVMIAGKVATQKSKSGPGVQAFAYGTAEGAAWGVQKIQERAQNAASQEQATLPLLQQLLATGVTVLVVDPYTPMERYYDRDDMVRMVNMLGGGAAASAGDQEEVAPRAPGVDPALDPMPGASAQSSAATENDHPEALKRALRYPALPPVPPAGRNDVDSRAAFQALRLSAENETIQIWEYIDALAFDLDLWVPVHPRNVDGLMWPQFFKHPEEEEKTIAYSFTGEAKAQEMMAEDGLKLQHLSGMEALRWVWAAPTAIDELAIDLYKDTDGWARFPNFWALSAIYPHFGEIESLDNVASVALGRLGGLSGARGLKPEAVKALLAGWKQLSSVAGTPQSVDLNGGRYLPVFSDPDQYFLFAAERPGAGDPLPAGDAPAFGAWLQATKEIDGVLLDPAGPHPLPLDHTDLLTLDLWSRGSQPFGGALCAEICRLLIDKSIDERLASRLVADWPRYFLVIQQMPNGGVSVLKALDPDRDWCAVFTSYEKAEFHLTVLKNLQIAEGEWQTVPILSRWDNSVFHSALQNFDDGLWIDSIPTEGGGLVMDHAMLEAAVERVDEKLKPRVPDFVWRESW